MKATISRTPLELSGPSKQTLIPSVHKQHFPEQEKIRVAIVQRVELVLRFQVFGDQLLYGVVFSIQSDFEVENAQIVHPKAKS